MGSKLDYQSQFMIFNGQKEHGDNPVLSVQEQIETDFAQNLIIGVIASKYATYRRTLKGRFRASTGNTVLEYSTCPGQIR